MATREELRNQIAAWEELIDSLKRKARATAGNMEELTLLNTQIANLNRSIEQNRDRLQKREGHSDVSFQQIDDLEQEKLLLEVNPTDEDQVRLDEINTLLHKMLPSEYPLPTDEPTTPEATTQADVAPPPAAAQQVAPPPPPAVAAAPPATPAADIPIDPSRRRTPLSGLTPERLPTGTGDVFNGIPWLEVRTTEGDKLVEAELRLQVASELSITPAQVQPQQLNQYVETLRDAFEFAGDFLPGMTQIDFRMIMEAYNMTPREIQEQEDDNPDDARERIRLLGNFPKVLPSHMQTLRSAWLGAGLMPDATMDEPAGLLDVRDYILKELKKAGVPINSVDRDDLENLMRYHAERFMEEMDFDVTRIDTTPQDDHFFLQDAARTFAEDMRTGGLAPAIMTMQDEIAAAKPEEDIRTAAIIEFIDKLPYKQSKKDRMKSKEGLASFEVEYWAGNWDSIEQFLLAEGEGSATEFAAELLEMAERGAVSQADFEAVRNFIDELTTVDALGVAPITDGQKTLLSSQANIEKFLQEYYISGQSMENFLASSGQKMATDIVETARGIAAGEDTREGRQEIFLERIGMSTKRGGLGIDITNPDARNIANQIFAKAEEEYLKEQLEGGKRTLKQIQDEFIGQMPTEAEIERRIELQYGMAPPGLTEDEVTERQKVMDAKLAALADKAKRGEEVTADEIMAASDPIQGIADIALERLSERIGTAEEVRMGDSMTRGEEFFREGGQRAWATRGTLAQQNALAQDLEMQEFLRTNPEAARAFATGDRDKLKNFLVGSTDPVSGAFIPGHFDEKTAFGMSDEQYEIGQEQGDLAPPPRTEEEDKNLALYDSILAAQSRQFPDKPIYDISQTPSAGESFAGTGGYFAAENLRIRQKNAAEMRRRQADRQAAIETQPRQFGGRAGF